LRPIGTDCGGGAADGFVFQLDNQFDRYRGEKLASRAERLDKYVLGHEYSKEVAAVVARWLIDGLCSEYPALFSFDLNELHCQLTGEVLQFDDDMRLIATTGGPGSKYVSAFDALCSQIQEDVAVVCKEGDRNWAAALHICMPSHWRAEDKIGTDFVATHAPVPHFEKINAAAPALVDAMVNKGPLVRFGWGVETDPRLNRHPDPPPGVDSSVWRSRGKVNETGAPFYMRVERQVLLPLPEVNASIFLIRTYLYDVRELTSDQRAFMRSAIESMSPQAREYKSVTGMVDELIAQLND
jgi:hypothetical protein